MTGKIYSSTCGNCKEPWPCFCGDPVWICTVCGGDEYDCPCDEWAYLQLQPSAQQGGQAELLSCTRCGENEAYEGGLCWDCLDG